MEKKYFQITFHFSGQPIAKELESTFTTLAEDWLRYSGNCWIIYTSKQPAELFNALKPFLKNPQDQILILELKKNQGVLHGWLQPWIWDWLNKVRT
jgi:hypothetical protein